MKTKLAAILAILSSVTQAAPETGAETESTPAPATLEEAVSASGWTVQELVAALDMIEAKYNRDMKTKEGRKFWHGKVQETVDTNTLTKVSVYEDGTVFRDPAKITTPSASANAQLARLQAQTNGIPERLAAARLRQRQNAETVSNVTVRITAGGAQ